MLFNRTTARKSLSTLLGGLLLVVLEADATPASAYHELGKELTPFGAQRAGNDRGTIPQWRAIPEPDWSPVGEKPLFVITAANYKAHAEHLTPGQQALFERYPDSFRMPVYPSRRDFVPPQRVMDATLANAPHMRMTDSGYGITGGKGGIPFPIPKQGIEALWNHKARFIGVSGTQTTHHAIVEQDGSYQLYLTSMDILFNYYSDRPDDGVLWSSKYRFKEGPRHLIGGSILVVEPLDPVARDRQTWGYHQGERRVRRFPNVDYDLPNPIAEGLRTADDFDMFSGSPDRYNWQLLGKQEIYIPYHNRALSDTSRKLSELLSPHHVAPEHTRYELHRVWLVRGTLRNGANHMYSRRDFYLDEDSWSIAVADQYDQQGKLWRVSLAFLRNVWAPEATVFPAIEAYHDLASGRYSVTNLPSIQGETTNYLEALPVRAFTPQALRQQGIR